MIISIFVYGRLKEFFDDAPSFSVSGSPDVLSVLTSFSRTDDGHRLLFDQSGSLRSQILIMVNKKRITAGRAPEFILSDGDEIRIYPAVSGG